MAWSDTEITITGDIRSQKAFDALVAAIVQDAPPIDGWGSTLISTEEEAIAALLEADDGKLVFAENERSEETFPQIEAACEAHGLGYVRVVSPDEEYDTPGSRTVWAPGFEEPVELPGVDDGNEGALVSVKSVQELLDAGKIEDLRRHLSMAADASSVLPAAFVIDPALKPAAAPAI